MLTTNLLQSQTYFWKYQMPGFHSRILRTWCLDICGKQMWHCMTLAPDFRGNTRCRVWPDTEPRESEATTYILLLLSAPHNPELYEVYLHSIRVSFPCQTPGNIMLGEWVSCCTLIWEMFNQVNAVKTSMPQLSLNGYTNLPSKTSGCNEFPNINMIFKNSSGKDVRRAVRTI